MIFSNKIYPGSDQYLIFNSDPAKVQENLGYYEFLRLLQDRKAIASTLGAHQTDELN